MGVFDQYEEITNKLKQMFTEDDDLIKLINFSTLNPLSEERVKNPMILLENNPSLSVDGVIIKPRIYFSQRDYNIVTDVGTVVIVNYMTSPISGSYNSEKLSIFFDVLIHNDCIILGDGSSRFNRIFGKIDERLNGNPNLSNGFSIFNKGVKFLNTQKEYETRRLVMTSTITNTHNYNKKFEDGF